MLSLIFVLSHFFLYSLGPRSAYSAIVCLSSSSKFIVLNSVLVYVVKYLLRSQSIGWFVVCVYIFRWYHFAVQRGSSTSAVRFDPSHCPSVSLPLYFLISFFAILFSPVSACRAEHRVTLENTITSVALALRCCCVIEEFSACPMSGS